MSCIIIAEFRCKPGRAEDFIELCRSNYPGTRDYDGCEYISLSVDQDDEDTLVMTEQWVSKEHHRRYSEFREGDGTSERITAMLAAEPTFRFLDLTDA